MKTDKTKSINGLYRIFKKANQPYQIDDAFKTSDEKKGEKAFKFAKEIIGDGKKTPYTCAKCLVEHGYDIKTAAELYDDIIKEQNERYQIWS